MIPAAKIQRRPLREEVYRALLDRVYTHAVTPGQTLNDVTLAGELGVSRTPIREALLRLEREGIVEAQMGRGFAVRPLDVEEIRNLYPMVWTLEELGIKSSPPFSASDIKKLRRLNEQFSRATDPFESVRLDNEFHAALLARCGNAHLQNTIAQLKSRLRRYELTFMRETEGEDQSTRAHDEIIDALERGDLARALSAQERNWRRALDLVDAWMQRAQDPGRLSSAKSLE
jgi:DNA-binding GntR family transcriptional regulator